ncbi:MAG: type II secretory pathway pseudopilin PulG, partial [Hyphomicrobiaceae bacterium]
MGLRLKFNVILALTLVLGLIASSIIFWQVAESNAREQLHSQIAVLRAQALAVRRYTSEEIKPLLAEQSGVQFLPQTIPSFSAQTAFANFKDRFPSFSYKEAALNPTNPSDKASPWEEKLIKQLRRDTGLKEIVKVRSTAQGERYTVAFPLQIKSEGCLACHSTPDKASKSMVSLYGDKNGFGWKMNEIIGAQIFSVPLSVARDQIWDNLAVLIGSMSAIFLVLMVLLNVLLSRLVITPVTQMSKIAEAVSMGDNSQAEYTLESADE